MCSSLAYGPLATTCVCGFDLQQHGRWLGGAEGTSKVDRIAKRKANHASDAAGGSAVRSSLISAVMKSEALRLSSNCPHGSLDWHRVEPSICYEEQRVSY